MTPPRTQTLPDSSRRGSGLTLVRLSHCFRRKKALRRRRTEALSFLQEDARLSSSSRRHRPMVAGAAALGSCGRRGLKGLQETPRTKSKIESPEASAIFMVIVIVVRMQKSNSSSNKSNKNNILIINHSNYSDYSNSSNSSACQSEDTARAAGSKRLVSLAVVHEAPRLAELSRMSDRQAAGSVPKFGEVRKAHVACRPHSVVSGLESRRTVRMRLPCWSPCRYSKISCDTLSRGSRLPELPAEAVESR